MFRISLEYGRKQLIGICIILTFTCSIVHADVRLLPKSEQKSKHKHHSSSKPSGIKRRLTAFNHHISRVLVHITPPFRSYHILHINPVASHMLFDEGWLFKKDTTIDASTKSYIDSTWRKLDLPHDWSIEDLPGGTPGKLSGPFSTISQGASATGNTIGGISWYRKHFNTGDFGLGRRTVIEFEGVYMNAEVWLNGHYLASHAYGYTPFYVELSDFMSPAGEDNVLVVKVSNTGKNSRWYSGSGIYRHVWFHSMPALHIVQHGLQVLTPIVSEKESQIEVRTLVKNQGRRVLSFKMYINILDSTGKIVQEGEKKLTIEAGKEKTFASLFNLKDVRLWSCETPALYKVKVGIQSGSTKLDEQSANFGFRTLTYNSSQGLLLNGKKILLRGGCLHHDNGILGSMAIDRAEERRVDLLKSFGFNAVRTSHNPPSEAFLNACDLKGILVLDEAFDVWKKAKNPADYHLNFDLDWKSDLDAMLVRDRNHPSIIMWSIGNEIQERADPSGLKIGKMLAEEVHHMDSTRPVTMAVCDFWDNKGYSWNRTAPAFENLDIAGYNYQWKEYLADHKKYPSRIMLGTESFPKEAWNNWNSVEKYPWVIGDFVWTAMDYLGEAGLAHTYTSKTDAGFSLPYPNYNAWSGDIDLCGFKKPQSFYRDVVWGKSKIEMLVHVPMPSGKIEKLTPWAWPNELDSWTWPVKEGTPMLVSVYSIYHKVRLKLNGKVIAEMAISDTSRLSTHFTVPYSAGLLEATGLENGKEMNSMVLRTAGKPFAIRLLADKTHITGRNDLAYITAEVIDEAGNRLPDASLPLTFHIEGPAELAAFGNSSPDDASSFRQPYHLSFRGRALCIIRPLVDKQGSVIIRISSPGLKEGELRLESAVQPSL